jgi:hypothetical protein
MGRTRQLQMLAHTLTLTLCALVDRILRPPYQRPLHFLLTLTNAPTLRVQQSDDLLDLPVVIAHASGHRIVRYHSPLPLLFIGFCASAHRGGDP